MKVYAAIGHWKGSENITSVAERQVSKKDFLQDLRGNEFVPYVVITEGMMKRLVALTNESFGLYDQVKKMTSNYRVWNDVTEYLEQCFDILCEKISAAHR